MTSLRAYFRDRRRLGVALVVLALAMKALVPGGFMPLQQGRVLTVAICADASGGHRTRDIVVPSDGKAGEHAKAEGTCPYAALGAAALAGADAILLALALAFIVALDLAAVHSPRPARAVHWRPWLRGPPALA